VLCNIAKTGLEPVTRFPEEGEINSGALPTCTNGKMGHCVRMLASWLADRMGHANLMGVKYNACPQCQTLKDELGSLILPLDLECHPQMSAVLQQEYG